MPTYAITTDDKTAVKKVFNQADVLTQEQMDGMNAVLFETVEPVYNPATEKLAPNKTISIVDGVAKQIQQVLPKDDDDFMDDAIAARRRAIPALEEQLELINSLLSRAVRWIALQADPAKPHTLFDVSTEELSSLDAIQAQLESVPLPDLKRRVAKPAKP
jgi:hypothetical protein